MSDHEHYWRHAQVSDARGESNAGRRCDCGMETIGGLNAEVVRTGQRFHDSMTQAFKQIDCALAESRRRRFEP